MVRAAIESAPSVSDGALDAQVFGSQWLTLDVFGLIFGVMCVVTALYMWTDVESPTQAMADRRDVPLQYLRHSQYAQILLAVGGFAVWVYYLGGPFAEAYAHLYDQTYATILLRLYVGGPNWCRTSSGSSTGSRAPTSVSAPPTSSCGRGRSRWLRRDGRRTGFASARPPRPVGRADTDP